LRRIPSEAPSSSNKRDGSSRKKLRVLLETIVYDVSLLTDDVFEERYKVSIDPKAVALFGKQRTCYRARL
jgi:hypothetical protein